MERGDNDGKDDVDVNVNYRGQWNIMYGRPQNGGKEGNRYEEYKGLKNGQVERCKEAFKSFDTNGNNRIEIDELEAALINMGHKPTEEELYLMMNEDNEDGETGITQDRFLDIIAKQKKLLEDKMRPDLLDTYLALGGKLGPDKLPDDENGKLDLALVKDIIKEQFKVDIDVDKMSGKKEITFNDFMDIMSG